MAKQNTVEIGVEVSSGESINRTIKLVKSLHDLLANTVAVAAKFNLGGGAGGGGAGGGGGGAGGGGGVATLGRITQATGGSNAMASYGTQRGVAGATGASARDFAKEADGLGGLVRVYAAFAANIYALGAAFTALSAAMDTTNMIKGLDQLGVASGRDLLTLSKSLSAVTGGALSMKESMASVAASSAAGLNADQITKMGVAAAKASQVLGLNLPDAFNRISRGVTKLEPELLDELGLFTKIGPATEEYAKSVGKSASQLTDFEKRQAFANAVLKEAADKFGKIEIDTNPFVKLTATFKDLMQSGLELVNKVIGPIISLLASSPTALALVVAGLGNMLLQKTIPAIGQFKEKLQEASEAALGGVAVKSTSFRNNLVVNQAAITASAELEAEKYVSARDAATEKFNKLSKSKLGKMSSVSAVLEKGIYQIEEADIQMLEKRAQKSLLTNSKLSASYTELANTIRAGQSAEGRYKAERAKGDILAAEAAVVSKKTMLADIEFKELSIKAVQREMIAKAAATTKELGFVAALRESWTQYNRVRNEGSTIAINVPGQFIKGADGQKVPAKQDIKVDPLTGTAATIGLVSAGATAAASAVGGLVSKLGAWGLAAVGIYEVGSLLYSGLTANSKQAEELKSAFGALISASEMLDKVFKDISEKEPLKQISTESIIAKANAIDGLIASMDSSSKATKASVENMNIFNYPVEGVLLATGEFLKFFGITKVGFDEVSKNADLFGINMVKVLKSIEPSETKDKKVANLKAILGVDPEDIKAISEIDITFKTQQQALKELKELGIETSNAASRAKELDTAFETASKSIQGILTSAIPTDPIAKLSIEMMDVSNKMSAAFKDPVSSLNQLAIISKDITKLRLFDPALASEILKLSPAFNKAAADLTRLKNEQIELIKIKAAADKELDAVTKYIGKTGIASEISKAAVNKAAITNVALAQNRSQIEDANKLAKEGRALLDRASEEMFERASKNLQNSIALGFAKANLTIRQAYATVLGDTITGIKLRGDLQKESNNLQLLEIEAKEGVIDAQENLRVAVEANTIAIQRSNVRSESGSTAAQKLDKEKELDAREKALLGGREAALKGETVGSNAAAQKTGTDEERAAARARAPAVAQRATMQSKRAEIGAQNKTIDIATGVSVLDKETGNEKERLGIIQDQLTARKSIFDTQTGTLSFLSDSLMQEKNSLEQQILQNKYAMDSLDIEKERFKQLGVVNANNMSANKKEQDLADKAWASYQEVMKRKENVDAKYTIDKGIQLSKQLSDEQANDKKINEIKIANAKFLMETEANQKIFVLEQRTSELEITSIVLENQKNMNSLTNDEYRTRKMILDLAISKKNADERSLSIVTKYDSEITSLNDKYKELVKTDESGTVVSDAQAAAGILNRIKLLNENKSAALAGLQATRSASDEATKALASLNDRQIEYGKIFENSFQGMADAIVEFARTGKLSFKDLINNMIADLVRFELREQASSLYRAAKPGLMDFIGSMFGGNISGSDVPMAPVGPIGNYPAVPFPMSQGAAYDMGIKKFAMGGTFANSIVSSPTLFKFASGTGLMGEAGPEAIMPLKRDAQGNLGVRSGNNGGNVEVVVNNYGSDKATTTESTDSRGNRKVEVIIGDLSAGDISKSGSNSQRSLRGTYGLQPALIRR